MKVKKLKVGKIIKTDKFTSYLIAKKTNYNGEDYYLRFPIDKQRNITGEGSWGRIEILGKNYYKFNDVSGDNNDFINTLYNESSKEDAAQIIKAKSKKALTGASIAGAVVSAAIAVTSLYPKYDLPIAVIDSLVCGAVAGGLVYGLSTLIESDPIEENKSKKKIR